MLNVWELHQGDSSVVIDRDPRLDALNGTFETRLPCEEEDRRCNTRACISYNLISEGRNQSRHNKDAASSVHSKLWWVKWKQSIVTNFMLDLQEVGIS